jgi:hypothetical protein
MAGGLRAPLPKTLELLDRHLRIAGEMQQRIEQHRGVAGRENEAIAILPRRRFRIVAHEIGPEDEGHVGHAHRRTGMTRFRLLDAIVGEEADGVDAKLFELVLVADFRLVVAFRLGDRGACLGRSARLFVHGSSIDSEPRFAQDARLYSAPSGALRLMNKLFSDLVRPPALSLFTDAAPADRRIRALRRIAANDYRLHNSSRSKKATVDVVAPTVSFIATVRPATSSAKSPSSMTPPHHDLRSHPEEPVTVRAGIGARCARRRRNRATRQVHGSDVRVACGADAGHVAAGVRPSPTLEPTGWQSRSEPF